jgi:hypothetical protein
MPEGRKHIDGHAGQLRLYEDMNPFSGHRAVRETLEGTLHIGSVATCE